MLRNNLTHSHTYGYMCMYMRNCVTLYKYIRKNKGLESYAWSYASVTQSYACVTGEAL
jgi:hypothetical protein